MEEQAFDRVQDELKTSAPIVDVQTENRVEDDSKLISFDSGKTLIEDSSVVLSFGSGIRILHILTNIDSLVKRGALSVGLADNGSLTEAIAFISNVVSSLQDGLKRNQEEKNTQTTDEPVSEPTKSE